MPLHLVLFGDNKNYKRQRERLVREATQSGWFDTVMSMSEDDISDFLSERSTFLTLNPKGLGLWAWKPYIISQALQRIPEGDILVYLDASARLLHHKKDRLIEYEKLMMESTVPVLTFYIWQKERGFTKRALLKRLGLEHNEEFLDSGQAEGGAFLCINTQGARDFVSEWLTICTEREHENLMDSDGTDELPGFIAHRHDQSVLSALCKLRGAAVLSTECYGIGPFFLSRVSDHGPRPNAPDSFRMDPSYDPDRHPTWSSYLDDPETLVTALRDARDGISKISSTLSWGEDHIQSTFHSRVEDLLSVMQHTRGLWRVELSTDEPDPSDKLSRDTVSGRFSVSTRVNKTAHLYFKANKERIIFDSYKLSDLYLYKKEWTRQWGPSH
jgi:hypothetical protein